MELDINDIENAIFDLAPQQRARLVRRLIASLDQGEDENAEQLWLEEAERRLQDYHSARTTARSAEDVLTELENSLK